MNFLLIRLITYTGPVDSTPARTSRIAPVPRRDIPRRPFGGDRP
jgi:hypothetical protein